MAAANAGKLPRTAGQWTATACQVWREAGPEASRLLEAALAWELATGWPARPEDEAAVRRRRAQMDAATEKARAKAG
jgi:hypothetical protein